MINLSLSVVRLPVLSLMAVVCWPCVCEFAGLRLCFSWRRAAACVHFGGASVECCCRPQNVRLPCGCSWTIVATEYSYRQLCPIGSRVKGHWIAGMWVVGSVIRGSRQRLLIHVSHTLQRWFLLNTWMSPDCRTVSFQIRLSIPKWAAHSFSQWCCKISHVFLIIIDTDKTVAVSMCYAA